MIAFIRFEITSKPIHIEGVGGGFTAANPSVCMTFDVLSNRIHAFILYIFIYVTTCECIHAIVLYVCAAVRRNI